MSTAEGWRYHAELEFNGVDPDGEEPPDEIIANSENHADIELIRRDTRWQVISYPPDGSSGIHHSFASFGGAFAFFSAILGDDQ